MSASPPPTESETERAARRTLRWLYSLTAVGILLPLLLFYLFR